MIKDALATLDLPPQAVAWLLDLWQVTQFFDDVADGDDFPRGDLDRAIWAALIGMPANPFFVANSNTLLPAMAAQVLKWQASDKAERNGRADARSYTWRAGYYDVVLMVCHLCHGADFDPERALGLYGETLPDYCKEFSHA